MQSMAGHDIYLPTQTNMATPFCIGCIPVKVSNGKVPFIHLPQQAYCEVNIVHLWELPAGTEEGSKLLVLNLCKGGLDVSPV